MAWLLFRSHILAVLSHDAVNTLLPSSLQQTSSTGPVCICWAFGMVCPLSCTSQQRTSLAHDPAIRKFPGKVGGLKDRQPMLSSGEDVTSISFIGLWLSVVVLPNMLVPPVPKPEVVPNRLMLAGGAHRVRLQRGTQFSPRGPGAFLRERGWRGRGRAAA